MPNLYDIRNDYQKKILTKKNVPSNPVTFFESWLTEAIDALVNEPTAMSLSTVSESGCPSSRIVLLKEVAKNGFVFFTNYSSAKAVDIQYSGKVCLLFFWPELERQVRVEGMCEMIEKSESDIYFASRPFESRIGAWASEQSKAIPDRTYLEDRVQSFKQKYANKEIPRPEFWGGFIVNPIHIEFWQGRPSRLHDRIKYSKRDDIWEIYRLAP